ncbi:endopeptidase [Lonepinella koalarum]|uniref:Spr peptidase n=1 Tax=Lonepinella koalarum TaxID=53417 RepID=A0A4R1L0I7_9PAST|nr:NlpC/P60 family protein [Lonepinella koalarum]MDH2926953.1 endopeptidase [Lonepinella koalarum]TCK70390.1 spr peptidase [Lonepinella koalarum]TFJ89227.1 endopeptidase [Lonepinella koalarum]TYG33671.1 endopeptidase [Lonepinella koalarum]
MLKKILIIASVTVLAACSNTSRQAGVVSQQNNDQLTTSMNGLRTNKPSLSMSQSSSHASGLNKDLALVYNQWAGTRYRMGGTSSRGIDCSAFMQETFAAAFGMSLPRSTSEQQRLGQRIQKSELKQGDLVFFRKNRHVGVYIGNGQFMHSSSSQGVTISSLSEAYWARTYTQSRRVL